MNNDSKAQLHMGNQDYLSQFFIKVNADLKYLALPLFLEF